MAGAALSLFTDFFTQTTGPALLSGPDEIINDAQLRNYEAYDALSRAKKDVQGGSSIKDVILFDTNGQATTYLSGAEATVTNTNHLSTISVPWRFVRVPITWNEKEIMLNEGGSGDATFQQFKKLKESKYKAAYTDLYNRLERLMVAAPSHSAMEASDGTDPYSIFASVTSDGLAPAGFTTVQGVNPTSQSKWRNQTASYTASAPLDSENGVIAAFDEMSQLVKFKKPSNAERYFTDSELASHVILTNKEGRRLFMKAIRANNDLTRVGPQDPSYPDPVFNNIPVRACEAFDDRAVFSAGAPHYLFLNMNHIKLIFHREKWMQVSAPMSSPTKPDTMVVWVDTWLNVFNCSRQRHGYVKTV